ncbi:hypothetical protein A9Q84_02850 [Halobacteriovorax marinus]|uniref:BFD-like [2Fe-2S]-binding domain-containing protein n=1 Tax=Halobacteriovorax marinus TaxID=97084 RepID=A0A1Y5FJF3_9BACT|nr:hypothetical protein A9Q84_02850 [Halobacteriovorax marinus]
MYICVCKGITEEQLEKAIKPESKPSDVLKDLGVGDSCGICLLDAIERISKSNQTKVSKSKK